MPRILSVPPEIFSLVASHVPLQLLPASLSALAQTCTRIHFCVQPELYRKIVIKEEQHALQVLERISTDDTLGRSIREFHLLLDLSAEIHKKQCDTTALVKLHKVIEKGSLSHLNVFRLVLLKFYNPDEEEEGKIEMNARYNLPSNFWTSLKHCPRLREFCVDSVEDSCERSEAWEPEFYNLEQFMNLNMLSLKYSLTYFSDKIAQKLCQNIASASSSLQSLTIAFSRARYSDAGHLFSITFPQLRSITIWGIRLDYSGTKDSTLSFWTRHPRLEKVNIYTHFNLTNRWFPKSVLSGLLPNLKHLTAKFNDVRSLFSHLGQLERLAITSSYNHQIPYLLRGLFSDGLPKLRSLEIHQMAWIAREIRSTEGAMWYEAENGEFLQERRPKHVAKFVNSSYMQSIVRGAPNLEELCIHAQPLFIGDLLTISPILGQLKHLERLSIRAFTGDQRATDASDLDDFRLACHLLGYSCHSLRDVTAIDSGEPGPYRKGTILRGFEGRVDNVVLGFGFGMEFTGGDDDPFPLNKLP